MSNTQNNSSNNNKTVLYYGKEIQLPNKAKWIHTDSDGAVYTTQYPETTGARFYITGDANYVHSFNHTEMSVIDWTQSQKRISDLPSVCTRLEQAPHPHADLMLKYAQIAQYSDKPWEEFEFKNQYTKGWMNVVDYPCWGFENEYRLKPQPIRIEEGQVWRSTKESVLVKVHSVKHPELQRGSIVVAQRINPELTLYSELTKTELQEHFTLVK